VELLREAARRGTQEDSEVGARLGYEAPNTQRKKIGFRIMGPHRGMGFYGWPEDCASRDDVALSKAKLDENGEVDGRDG